LPLEQLGRNVLRRAAEGGRAARLVDVLLGQAEVGEGDVPLVVHQNVLELEVSVHDALLVQVLEGGEQLGAVELSAGLLEGFGQAQVHKESACVVVVRDQVQLVLALEGEAQAHDVRMPNLA